MAKEILTGSKASTVVKTLNGRAVLDTNSIHGLSASGNTITYTKGDGTTTDTVAITTTENDITPIAERTYENILATANNYSGSGCAFMCVELMPETYTELCYVKLKIESSYNATSNSNTHYTQENIVELWFDRQTLVCYKLWNSIANSSYRPLYYVDVYRVNQTGFNAKKPHYIGVSLYGCNGATVANNGRTITVKVLATTNCSTSFRDVAATDYTNLYKTDYYAISHVDAASAGLQETGDSNSYDRYSASYERRYAGSKIYAYKLLAIDANGKVQAINLTSGAGTAKVVNTTPFHPQRLFYYNSSTERNAGDLLDASVLYEALPTSYAQYWFNASLPTYHDAYLCGDYDASTNLFTLCTKNKDGNNSVVDYYTFKPNNVASVTLSTYFRTGKYYIFVGSSYSTANYIQLSIINTLYYFDGTNLVPVIARAETANSLASDVTIDASQIDGKVASATVADSANAVAWANVSGKPSFFDGNYNSLTNKPTIPTVNNATLTIQKNGTQVATFTANASSNVTANITVPTVTDTYSSTSSNAMSGKAVASALSTTKVGSATSADSATTADTANALASTATIEASQVNGLSTLLSEAGKVKTVNSIQPDTNGNVALTNVSMGQGYGTCTTAAATAAKVGTLTNYSLITGGVVSIKFTYAVPASATLNINSKGAKYIYNRGSAIAANVIAAGDTATFMYDGTRYNLLSIDKAYLTSHQSLTGYVPTTRTVNSKALSSNITLTASDVGALPVDDPTATSGLKVKNTSLTKGTNPSSITFNGVWITDSSATQTQATRLGGFETQVNTNGDSITRLQGYSYGSGSGSADATTIQLGVRADGSKWTSVTPPPDDSWDDSIATTGWVRSNVGGALDIDYLADEQLLVFERQTQQTESVHSESVGFITISLSNTVPAGYLPLIGYTYSRSAYADLYNYALINGLVISDSDWLAMEANQNGNVPFYSSGDGSTTFRVPKLNGWVKAGESAGTYIEAGLPNIEGEWIPGIRNPSNQKISGAFSEISGSNVSSWSSSGNNTPYGFKFDASGSNSIYGNSNTVQPESVSVIYVVKAFGELTNIGSTDLSTLSDQITYITNNYVPKNGGTANNLRVDGLTLEGRKVMRNPEKVKIYTGSISDSTMNFSQSWRNFDALCFVVRCEGTGTGTMCTTVIKQAYEIQLLIDIGATNIGIDFQPRGDSDRSWLSYYLPNQNGSTDTSWVRAYRRLTYVAEVWGLTY